MTPTSRDQRASSRAIAESESDADLPGRVSPKLKRAENQAAAFAALINSATRGSDSATFSDGASSGSGTPPSQRVWNAARAAVASGMDATGSPTTSPVSA